MRPIEKISITSKETGYKIGNYSILGDSNSMKRVRANKVISYFEKTNNLSTEFEPVDAFIKDEESDNPDERKITYLYKQWDIEVFTIPNPQQYEYIENQFIDLILSMVKCEIIYNEPATNEFTYYNCHEDLHTNFFYEVRDTLLILHVSFCIKKAYGGEDMIIPNAKLRVSLRSSTVINN